MKVLKIYPSGGNIYFQGAKKGNTAYKVTVEGSLKDIYGQTLGKTAVADFKVGSAPASMYSQGGSMVILDPNSKPSYSIYSINHKTANVKIYQVTPQNWEAFRLYMRYQNYDNQKQQPLPGKLVFNKTVKIETKPDEMVETRLDLSSALNGGFGHAIVVVEPTVKRDKYDRTKIVAWLQATQLGLDAFVDNQELIGVVSDLKNGKPLSGVELTVYPEQATPKVSQNTGENEPVEISGSSKSWWEWLTSWGSAETPVETTAKDENGDTLETEVIAPSQSNQTGENGVLRLELPSSITAKAQSVLIAKKGKDVAFLPENADYYWQDYGTWYKKTDPDTLRWFVFNDRGIYKPKEEVAIKGYLRIYQGGKLGDIAEIGDKAKGISYVVSDSRGNEIIQGKTELNAFGAFDFKFKVPDNANLGDARVLLKADSTLNGSTNYHSFALQEFRRPEFEVKAKAETEAPYFVKSNAMVAVEAKYFAGGGLANADANWTVTSTPTNYTPPNRGDFNFGKWVPLRSYGGSKL